MARRSIHDPWLMLTTAVLVGVGLLMVGTASNYTAALEHGQNPSSFGWRHGVHLLLGCAALVACIRFPYQNLASRWVVSSLLIGSFVSLLVVLAMPEVQGVRRWIPMAIFNFQPSELAKLVAIVFVAEQLARKQEQVADLWSVALPCAGVVGSMALLVVVEPDLGSAVIPVVVAGVLLFVGGLRWRHVAAFGAIGGVAFTLAVLAKDYRIERILTFNDPWRDQFGSGYQLCQSLIAFGNGGLTGMGLGEGQQRALFLPAPHTDFIFSIIGEDFGLLGCSLLLGAFGVVLWRGLRTAAGAPDRFGFYLALGLTLMLVLQALINMGVCVGLLPTKGLPLPFISYGGSSLVASMAAMGLLLNISLYSN